MKGNFGFIRDKIEIKVLILFIMRRIPEPITFDVLTEITMCDDGISYFDYSESVADLVRTGHLQIEDQKYSLTPKGVRNGELTENSLPYPVRTKVEIKTAERRFAQSRDALIKTSLACDAEGVSTVKLSLSDGIGDIVLMELFAANKQQAQALENGFRKNAEGIYNALIEMILR